jgi:tetratricopeptide (TPR) repeat protein
LLAQLVSERHWTAADAVAAFAAAAQEMGLPHRVTTRTWERWCAAHIGGLPRPGCCRVLERLFQRPVQDLLAAPGAEPGSPVTAAGPAAGSSYQDLVVALTQDVTGHVAMIESAVMGPAAMEQLCDDVSTLARGYASTPPWVTFDHAACVWARGRGYLNRTAQPGQLNELYLILGQLCGLLATASFDLGLAGTATAYARAAWGYGEHVGHNALRAWARGTQALIAYWSGRPQDAVRLAQTGRDYLDSGAGLVRACCIEGRAWSHLGNRRGVEAAIAAAKDAREHGTGRDDLHDGIGGEFAFGPARQARCQGSAYLQLGDTAAAIRDTGDALRLYEATGQRNLKVVPQAHASLAAAYLMQGNLDAAAAQLRDALAVPAEFRLRGLLGRLAVAGQLLSRPAYQRAPRARALREELAEFAATPARPALTSRWTPAGRAGGPATR